MPIKTLQRRGRQIGEIRIGMVVPTSNGKTRPTKLDAFRFTTKSVAIAEAVADLLGGEARPVELQHGEQTYEVITSATSLPVMVPPGDAVISQWNEMWRGGGCQRRCDGEIEQLSGEACKCPLDVEERINLSSKGNACKPTTRVNVMLPDLPDLGVWKLESHGYYAAIELGGAAEVLAHARNAGVIVPATLRLEQRQVKRGGETRKFAVPVLEIGATLREMTGLSSGQEIASALPPPPSPAREALGSGAPVVVVIADDEPIDAEVVEHDERSLAAVIVGMSDEGRSQLDQRLKKNNFPAVETLPLGGQRQVRRWIEEIKAEEAKGAPFE